MVVEELIGKLGLRATGLNEARKFIKALEDCKKAAKGAGDSLRHGFTGNTSGLGRVARDFDRAAAAARRFRTEAERASRVRPPSSFGGRGGYDGGSYSGRQSSRSGGGGFPLEAGLSGAGFNVRAGAAAATAYGAGRVVQSAARSSMDFERTMIEVKKATDADPAGRAMYEKAILRLARDTGKNKEDLARMLSAAAFAGRPKGDLVRFTEFGAKSATAWGTTPEATGKALAQIGNIYEANQAEIERIADQINTMADESGSSETDLMEIVRRVGGTFKTAGFKTGDPLALGATLLERGVEPEIAASGLESFVNFLKLGDKYSDGAGEAIQKLGTTSNKLKKDFAKAPLETALKFLDKINSIKDPSKRAEILTGGFGKERQDDVERMASSIDRMRVNLGKMGDEKLYRGSVMRQYAEQLEEDVSKIDQATQQIDVLLKRVGDPIKQGLGYGAEKMNKALDYLDDRTGNKAAKPSNFTDDLPGLEGLSAKPSVAATAKAIGAITAASFADRFGAAAPMEGRRSFMPHTGTGIPRAYRKPGGVMSLGYGNLGATADNAPSFGAGTFGIGGGQGTEWMKQSMQQAVNNITNNNQDQRQQSVTVNQTVNGVPGVAQAAASGVSNALSGMGPSIVKANPTPTVSTP
ncbi:phage tail tape measure protein [Methylorubrum podarium]|uniref:Phage tail tape measure protein n=1 Tax=Methylorubrum podarium TaxID=200476 RepID=A0ABV1QVH4_9HYPH